MNFELLWTEEMGEQTEVHLGEQRLFFVSIFSILVLALAFGRLLHVH